MAEDETPERLTMAIAHLEAGRWADAYDAVVTWLSSSSGETSLPGAFRWCWQSSGGRHACAAAYVCVTAAAAVNDVGKNQAAWDAAAGWLFILAVDGANDEEIAKCYDQTFGRMSKADERDVALRDAIHHLRTTPDGGRVARAILDHSDAAGVPMSVLTRVLLTDVAVADLADHDARIVRYAGGVLPLVRQARAGFLRDERARLDGLLRGSLRFITDAVERYTLHGPVTTQAAWDLIGMFQDFTALRLQDRMDEAATQANASPTPLAVAARASPSAWGTAGVTRSDFDALPVNAVWLSMRALDSGRVVAYAVYCAAAGATLVDGPRYWDGVDRLAAFRDAVRQADRDLNAIWARDASDAQRAVDHVSVADRLDEAARTLLGGWADEVLEKLDGVERPDVIYEASGALNHVNVEALLGDRVASVTHTVGLGVFLRQLAPRRLRPRTAVMCGGFQNRGDTQLPGAGILLLVERVRETGRQSREPFEPMLLGVNLGDDTAQAVANDDRLRIALTKSRFALLAFHGIRPTQGRPVVTHQRPLPANAPADMTFSPMPGLQASFWLTCFSGDVEQPHAFAPAHGLAADLAAGNAGAAVCFRTAVPDTHAAELLTHAFDRLYAAGHGNATLHPLALARIVHDLRRHDLIATTNATFLQFARRQVMVLGPLPPDAAGA